MFNSVLKSDAFRDILRNLAANDNEKSELAKVVALTQVSRKWNHHVNRHFGAVYGISLFERGLQVFANELITMAFITKRSQDSQEEALIKAMISAAMLDKVDQLNFSK